MTSKASWQETLNDQQRKAVTFDRGPLLILAGAGSGKTRVLTYRTAFLILEKQLDPTNLILVTFTNKAAEEMRGRLKNLLPTSQLPFAGTFHSFCAQVLRRDGSHLGISRGFLIYDETDQTEAVKQVMQASDLDMKRWNPKAVLATISAAKNELIMVSEYAQFARGKFQEIVAQVYPAYQNLLKKNQALDFDDLLMETVRLFQKEPTVLATYQDRLRHILIDEYQDTNKAQYQLSKLLALKHHQLTVVGDASQSIYSWRGADFRNLSNLKQDFPDLTTIHLEQNYRSTQTILDAAHAVIRHNQSHPILKLWTTQDLGSKVILYEAATQREEANFIMKTVKDDQRRYPLRFSFNNYAVLYRTNAQSRTLEEALMRQGIPYRLVGGIQFYQRKEIKDCLAYLHLVANPEDTVSLARAEKIGKLRFQGFTAWREKLPTKLPPTETLLNQILQTTAYLDQFNKEQEQDLMRLENVKELASVATEFPDLLDFLENVSLVQQDHLPKSTTIPQEQPEAVTLMTLHAAKGLEFPSVFLIGMEEGLFPHSRSLLSKEELEEERRLCYVGITRAQKQLFLTYARRRLWFGSLGSNPVSRFVGDLPEQLLQFVTDGSPYVLGYAKVS
jgi:DNA helicase-2/ATP-dependent DNA helicase PcrA